MLAKCVFIVHVFGKNVIQNVLPFAADQQLLGHHDLLSHMIKTEDSQG